MAVRERFAKNISQINTTANNVYMPFLIVTSFANQEPVIPRTKTKAKLAPINGTYT